MTEHSDRLSRQLSDPDLALITDYLVGELEPHQVAEVRRRLDEDPAFREFAAPIIAAWTVAPRWQRKALPRAELEKSWDRFTRRAGFTHQRRRRRMRIAAIFAVVVVVLGGWAVLSRTSERGFPVDVFGYEILPDTGGEYTLVDGTHVTLTPGASLRSGAERQGQVQNVKLRGTARFRMVPERDVPFLEWRILAVYTAAAVVVGGAAEFEIAATGDTTEVEMITRPLAPWDDRVTESISVITTMPQESPVTKVVSAGERVRVLPDGRIDTLPPRLPPTKRQ